MKNWIEDEQQKNVFNACLKKMLDLCFSQLCCFLSFIDYYVICKNWTHCINIYCIEDERWWCSDTFLYILYTCYTYISVFRIIRLQNNIQIRCYVQVQYAIHFLYYDVDDDNGVMMLMTTMGQICAYRALSCYIMVVLCIMIKQSTIIMLNSEHIFCMSW